MKSFIASIRTNCRPMMLGVLLVAGLHLCIGVLAMLAIVHPTPTATHSAVAATQAPAAVQTAAAKPTTPAKAPAPVTVDATADASSPAVAKPAGHATLFGPLLLARESAGLAQLRAAGINLETLLHHAKPHHRRAADEGGPFVPVGAMREAALDPARLARLEKIIAHMPFAAPLVHYEVSSHFGIRRDPFDDEREFHTGIDLAAEIGTPVHATAPGVVDFAGWDGGYGRMIEINDGNGIRTRYAHLSRILVHAGERVMRHERIGLVGSTGRSTGPHLHYEVRIDGRPVNPAKFLAAGRIELVQAVAER